MQVCALGMRVVPLQVLKVGHINDRRTTSTSQVHNTCNHKNIEVHTHTTKWLAGYNTTKFQTLEELISPADSHSRTLLLLVRHHYDDNQMNTDI